MTSPCRICLAGKDYRVIIADTANQKNRTLERHISDVGGHKNLRERRDNLGGFDRVGELQLLGMMEFISLRAVMLRWDADVIDQDYRQLAPMGCHIKADGCPGFARNSCSICLPSPSSLVSWNPLYSPISRPIATMITLDEIIPYQPSAQLPPQPSPLFKTPSQVPDSPLIHPLPQRPVPQALLTKLTEDGLSWKQIKKHFPGRTEGSLQVRYCTKLKDQAAGSSVPTPCDDVPPPESDCWSRRQRSLHTPVEPSPRYGVRRSRRPVERYSP